MPTRELSKILIVDDHPLVRAGLRQLISDEPDFKVCGEAANVHEAVSMARETRPDLAIVDISLADGSGLDLIKRIHAIASAVRILVASMYDESIFAERAIRAGAMGYINKQEAAENVIEAVRQILDGKFYLSPQLTDHLVRQGIAGASAKSQNSVIGTLSDRELGVFEFIGRGLSTAQIAAKLKLSVKTIETHRAHIKKKLNLQSASELTMRAVQWTLER